MKGIPFQTIQAAKNGDPDAMNFIMQYFLRYIEHQSTECYSDRFENARYVVDSDLCYAAEIALENAVMKFKFQDPPEDFI